MSSSNGKAPRENPAEIIDRLYDVAVDPTRLDDLIDAWHDHAEDTGGPLQGAGIEAHSTRAKVFLDRYDAAGGEGYRAVLDEVQRSAAFVSDGVTSVVDCNRAARLAFGIEEGSPLEKLPFDADDIATLAAAIRRVASGKAERVVTLRIRSVATGGPVIVRVSAVASEQPLALVMSTELVWPEEFERTVQEAFGLTAAEVEIVRGLTMGLPIKEIAEARGRSVDTVRTQMRSILSKTETHSQSELVRVVLGLMDLSHSVRAGTETRVEGKLVGLPFQSLRRPDGRRVDWIEFGDPRGFPCVFTHLDYGTIRWPASAERQAVLRRIRVIVPVRAGYGATDLHPRGEDHLQGVTDDHLAILDHLRIGRVAIISQGADLRFALNIAAQRPGLVTGILGCAAQLPMRSAVQYERMDKWQRFILANARHAPKVLPFLVQAGFAMARKMGKDAFFRVVNARSPADMAVMDTPEAREALLLGSEVCLSRHLSAHEAFTRECIGSEKDWSDLVAGARVPVRLLQGDQDPRSPILTVQELQVDYPHLSVEILPGTGQLLFFKAWPTVLERLEDFLER